jgi:pyruvate-ferredoxin/flavodoxin oxidoreductase
LLQPLFEFSGACAGCGETPYIKLLTQLFGDRMLIANATGCSSIYGGNLPTTPYTHRTPTAAARLVELAVRGQRGVRLRLPAVGRQADSNSQRAAATKLGARVSDSRVGHPVLNAQQTTRRTSTSSASGSKRHCAEARLAGGDARERAVAPARDLQSIADYLVRKSVWIIGGDGWAYDIGYGGLDHVLASGATSTSW